MATYNSPFSNFYPATGHDSEGDSEMSQGRHKQPFFSMASVGPEWNWFWPQYNSLYCINETHTWCSVTKCSVDLPLDVELEMKAAEGW